jgi:hypothetical protein
MNSLSELQGNTGTIWEFDLLSKVKIYRDYHYLRFIRNPDYKKILTSLKLETLEYKLEIEGHYPDNGNFDYDENDDEYFDEDEDEDFNKDIYNLSEKPTESIESFITHCCIVRRNERELDRGSVENSILKAKYTEWCLDVGLDELSSKTFKKIMNSLGFIQNNDPERSWKNLSLSN